MAVNATQGVLKGLLEAAPDKTWRFGDLIRATMNPRGLVGTPEQVADQLQEWANIGIDGINIGHFSTSGTFEDFIGGVTPILQKCGLQQTEYQQGTLREKLTDGARRPRLASPRIGAGYRRRPVAERDVAASDVQQGNTLGARP
jgi:long-chain alkane monooxygenase